MALFVIGVVKLTTVAIVESCGLLKAGPPLNASIRPTDRKLRDVASRTACQVAS